MVQLLGSPPGCRLGARWPSGKPIFAVRSIRPFQDVGHDDAARVGLIIDVPEVGSGVAHSLRGFGVGSRRGIAARLEVAVVGA